MSRIIAFDLGTKTLGIAITDSLGIACHGLENFTFNKNGYRTAINHAVEIIKEKNVKEAVVGLALNMNGSESESSRASRIFRKELIKLIPSLQVSLIDERVTTMLANRYLLESDISRAKRKKVIDMESAVMILETYMENKANGKKKN